MFALNSVHTAFIHVKVNYHDKNSNCGFLCIVNVFHRANDFALITFPMITMMKTPSCNVKLEPLAIHISRQMLKDKCSCVKF